MNSNLREPNFWVRGKREQKKFYDIRLSRSTSAKTFILGLIFAAVIIIPIGLMIFQYLTIYAYNIKSYAIFLVLIWIGLMFFNGFSNYFTVKLAQSLAKDVSNLQEIEAKYVFLYQLLNIGFGAFSLFIIIFFGIQFFGVIR